MFSDNIQKKQILHERLMPITKGECLLLLRKRHGRSIRKQAKIFGVDYSTLRNWENKSPKGLPRVVRQLYGIFELLFLHRKRAGLSRKEVACSLDISSIDILKMEKGIMNSEVLIDYWLEKSNDSEL